MIYIENEQNIIKITEEFKEKLQEVILFALKEEEVLEKCEVSVLLVDNAEIKRINGETRGKDMVTDVLSFPMLEYREGRVYKEEYKGFDFDQSYKDGEELVLGDIVLCLERALEQSNEYNHSFEREAFYLTVHSVLHLLGYDHMEEEEKNRMRKREEEILGMLKIVRE